MHFGTSSAQEKGGSDEEKMQNSQLEKFKLKVLELLFFKPQVNCGEASSLRGLKNKRDLLVSNHRYDDTFGPLCWQIFL